MKDTKNILITMLCISAVMLGAILVLVNASTPAYASSPVRGGNYIMVNGAIGGGLDLIYVINVASQQLNVYGVDAGHNSMTLVDTVNLKAEFKK